MTTSPKKRRATANSPSALLKLGPVAAGCAALLMASGGVYAQQQANPTLGTVTVTGIRAAIESAISVKQGSDGVVEAISAEDIGKLPDTSIAESLARLPGLTTQRTKDGQASNISIRGLGPDFNGYLLNGREQTSTGDSRAVDLSVYPAELISGAVVYKTSDAGLMTAGLAGTIDQRLVDPLAYRSRVLSGTLTHGHNSVGLAGVPEGTENRKNLVYIDQFMDRKIGLAMGLVKVDGSSSELGSGAWGDAHVNATLTNGTVVPNVLVPGFGSGVDYRTTAHSDDRTGFAAILAYKPDDSFRTQIDLYYAKIDTLAKDTRIQGGLGGPITNATLSGSTATSGTFSLGASPNGLIDRAESIFDHDTIKSIGWKTTWKIDKTWSASVDLSHNSAERVERDIEAYAGIKTADTLTFNTNGGGIPQFTLGNPTAYTSANTIVVRDQTGWSGVTGPDGQTLAQAGYSKGPTIEDKVDAIRVDFKHELPQGWMFSQVQFGANYTDRSKDRTTDEGVIQSATNGGHDPIAFPSNSYVVNNVGGTGLNMLTFTPDVGLWPGAVIVRKYNDDILSKTWGVKEKVATAYVKFDIDTDYAGIPWRGNLGMQLVHTDQSSTGFQAGIGSGVTLNNPSPGLTSSGTSYYDVLPSLTLTGDFGGGNLLRLAAAEQIARPTLTDMRNSFAAAVDTNAGDKTFGLWIGSSGNPLLKPFKAFSLDASFEKYFDKKAYFSAAVFYKRLDTYITPATNTNYDFSSYISALNLAVPPGTGTKGIFTTTVNGSGGDLKGLELAGSFPFEMLTPVLSGFGASASVATTGSSVQMPNLIGLNPSQMVPTDGKTIPLPGLSTHNAKATLYYERNGFSAFIANNYRSTYVGSVDNNTIGGYPALQYIQGSNWISAQIGYEFQDGPLKGLGMRLEGNNLNSPVYRLLNADGTTASENRTGRSIAFRLSYKLQ
jgi:iron complex outermembrane receptor protein